MNDLLDLETDRADPPKRLRPFASGQLPRARGLAVAAILIAGGLGGAWAIGPRTLACCAVYLAVTLAYSLYLKRTPVLDVAILAFLYTLRLMAGGAASNVYLSPWLFLFSILFFLSLALVKRYAELNRNPAASHARGYGPAYLRPIGRAGFATGLLAALVPALYTNSADALRLYRRPYFLWGVCPLLMYWILRLWRTARRGGMYEDPVLFALRDPSSYAIAALIVCIALAATAGPA